MNKPKGAGDTITRMAILPPEQLASMGLVTVIDTFSMHDAHAYRARLNMFKARIQPFVDIKLYVAQITIPEMTIAPGCVKCAYPDWAQKIFDDCDKRIAEIADEFSIP